MGSLGGGNDRRKLLIRSGRGLGRARSKHSWGDITQACSDGAIVRRSSGFVSPPDTNSNNLAEDFTETSHTTEATVVTLGPRHEAAPCVHSTDTACKINIYSELHARKQCGYNVFVQGVVLGGTEGL